MNDENITEQKIKENSDEIDKSTKSDISPFDIITKENSEIDLIPKSGKYDNVFIFLHGLSEKIKDYIEIFNKKDGPIPASFKIVLPSAPIQYVSKIDSKTISWYDTKGKYNDVILESDIVFEDMDKAGDNIKKLIINEAKKINNDYSKIFLGGFSQGACLAYHVALSFDFTLGGLISFCGIPNSKTQIKENRNKLNILSIAAGKDYIFPFEYLKNLTFNILGNFTKLQFKELPDEKHSVSKVGLEETKNFIKLLI